MNITVCTVLAYPYYEGYGVFTKCFKTNAMHTDAAVI